MKKISYLGCLLISAALLLAFVPVATAATYYVSNSGSNSNPGTLAAPWQTIFKVQSILGSLQPGDSVLFERAGIWYQELHLSNLNGSAGSPITFGNYGTGNLPIIDGGGTVDSVNLKITGTNVRQWCIGGNIGSAYSQISYVTIDGFECRNTSAYGIVFMTLSAG